MTTRYTYKGLPVRCWRCWEKESGLCYSTHEDLGGKLDQGKIWPDSDFIGNLGRPITKEHFEACTAAGAFKSKRGILENLLGDVPLTIVSEENMKGGTP